MTNLKNVEELGLSSDNKIYIKNDSNDFYLITKSVSVVVLDNVSVKFIDKSNNANINITGKDYSNIKYIIIESQNTKRFFDIKGTLNIDEINIKDTNESLNVELNLENASVNVKNLTINKAISSKYYQHVIHNKPKTFSDIKNVAVALEGGNINYETVGKINKGMNNSNCKQISRGVVMDNSSTVESKPILLIDEYDCFANHGAAIGKVNDEDLFYLMSRGLNKTDAFLLILAGIINPFIDSLEYEEYRDELNNKINNLIEGR